MRFKIHEITFVLIIQLHCTLKQTLNYKNGNLIYTLHSRSTEDMHRFRNYRSVPWNEIVALLIIKSMYIQIIVITVILKWNEEEKARYACQVIIENEVKYFWGMIKMAALKR